MMRIYIAGKITGLAYEDALRAFAEAAVEIERCGHVAVNPMKENGLDGDGKQYEWVEYMERDIPLLLSCDGIYLLPNWKESNGARIEKVIAEHSKMLIVTHGFPGNRGEIFATCRDCGSVLDRDADGVFHCGGCRMKLKSLPANNAKFCGRCGISLDGNSAYIGASECFSCRNLRLPFGGSHHTTVTVPAKPEEWIECQADGCSEKFIQTDPEAEVDLCPPCDAAVIRAGTSQTFETFKTVSTDL